MPDPITLAQIVHEFLTSPDQAGMRAKIGLIELGVADPTAGAGVAASIGVEGQTNETPPRFFKKVGAGDTEWDQILTVGAFGSPTGAGILSFDESGNMVLISEIDGGAV